MKHTITLAAATALTLFAGSAMAADGNESFIDQNGTSNSASITQSGSNNDAGSTTQHIVQQDFRNQLTILQSGSNNSIGLAANANGGTGGVYQQNNRSDDDANKLTITQSSDGNSVGAVSQTSNVNTQLGGNTANISQGGSGSNTIGSLRQMRGSSSSGNNAQITQTGSLNTIARIFQRSNQGNNKTNQLTVNMSGANNGNALALAGAASVSGAQSSTFIQGDLSAVARNSYINLTVSGSNNEFGITQYGESNSVGNVTISGDGNQLGVYQSGSTNTVALSTISGLSNNIGIRQTGTDNSAMVNITGDFNGGGMPAGVAGTLASANGLVGGLIKQDGLRNDASLTITNSNENQAAYLQDGNDNTIVGSISGVGDNSATVVQLGDSNMANFTQIGGSNVVAISQ